MTSHSPSDNADKTAAEKPMPPHLAAASGLLMGSADAVPGVSGGTIALIVGVYDRFIDALSVMVRSPFNLHTAEGRARIKSALALLIPLGFGLLVAYYLVTELLVGPREAPGILLHPKTAPMCYGFFFGLVLLSLREPWRRIKQRHASHFVVAALGCAIAAVFVGLPYSKSEPETWMLLYGGAGAITVMLLPGVSGSLLLVILGQYTAVAGAVHDRAFGKLGVFAVGLVIGVATFVPLLKYLLVRFHDLTMAALTGFMAGSLRALWPWKNNYVPRNGEMKNVGIDTGNLALVLVAAVVGGAVVWLLAMLERRILAMDEPNGQPNP